jgi:hypothetical protein
MGISTADRMVNARRNAFCRLSLLTAIAWNNPALRYPTAAPPSAEIRIPNASSRFRITTIDLAYLRHLLSSPLHLGNPKPPYFKCYLFSLDPHCAEV